MNSFRRTMLCLLFALIFLAGVGFGRNEPPMHQVLIACLLLIAFLYWTLSGWDTKDTSKIEARAALDNMAPGLRSQAETMLLDQGKIAAIRLIRAETGLGLKEAKELIDALQRQVSVN